MNPEDAGRFLEHRAKCAAAGRNAMDDPALRAKCAAAGRAAMVDPAIRAKQLAAVRVAMNKRRGYNATQGDDMKHLDNDRVYEAIAEGVERAIWRMITNATDMPCHDFYDTVGDAVERAMLQVTARKDVPTA